MRRGVFKDNSFEVNIIKQNKNVLFEIVKTIIYKIMQEHIKTSSQSPIQGQLPAQNVFEMRKILDNPSKKSIHIQFPTVKMPNNSQDHYHPTLLSFNNDG